MNTDKRWIRLHQGDSIENLSGAFVVAVTWVALYIIIIVVGLLPVPSQFIAILTQR